MTNSNSKLLSQETATLLSGSYKTINIYPFSYNELLNYYSTFEEITPQKEQEIFNDYLNYGGFPSLLKKDSFEKIETLDDIYNSLILKNILNQSNITNNNLLMNIIEYMITSTGKQFSSTNVINYIQNYNKELNKTEQQRKPSSNTVINYIQHAQDAFLLYEAKNEDLIGKKIFKSLSKYYVVDPGLYHLFRDKTRRDMDSLLESIIYIELLRLDYEVTVGRIYDIEVDFICRKENELIYIQVSESILGEKTREKELESLKKIKDNYPKYILTLDHMKLPTDDIIQKNIIDFLKEDKL